MAQSMPALLLEATVKEIIDSINRYSPDLAAFDGGIGEFFVDVGSYQLRFKVQQ